MTDNSLDNTLEILSKKERRKVLHFLSETPENEVHIDDVINELEYDYKGAKLGLLHNHLPKMDESGLIDYEPDSETIGYNPNPQLEELVETLQEYEDSL